MFPCLACKSGQKSLARAASLSPAAAGAIPPAKNVFHSPLTGAWFEADAGRLTAEIDSYLNKASTKMDSDVFALILPHAGLRYSGPTMAYAFNQIAGRRFSRVIVLGPSHHTAMRNMASVPMSTPTPRRLARLRLISISLRS